MTLHWEYGLDQLPPAVAVYLPPLSNGASLRQAFIGIPPSPQPLISGLILILLPIYTVSQ